jgi:hypothetical protein
MTLTREELWQEITPAATAPVVKDLFFAPGASGLGFLDALAAAFERYQLLELTVEWKPSCGTTRDGAIVIGIDWDPSDTGSSMAYVQSLEPRIRVPVWQGKQLPLPKGRLMSRRFLLNSASATTAKNPDYAAFKISAGVTQGTATAVGEVWVRYRIAMHGPMQNKSAGPALNLTGLR